MISEKRSQAARANGAKSRGPKTPEGKRQSSRNATGHGLLSDIVVLPGESVEGFEQLVSIHHNRFRPINPFEHEAINEMASSQWRLRRVWVMERAMMVRAIGNHTDEPTHGDRFAAAFCELADAPRLALLHRYEARLHMMYQRALKTLILVRTLPPGEPEPLDDDSPELETPASPEVAPDSREPISILTRASVPPPESPAPAAVLTQDVELPNEPKVVSISSVPRPAAPSSIPPASAGLPNKPKILQFPNPPAPPNASSRDGAQTEPDERFTFRGHRGYAILA